jgi:hypothetical protein
MLNAALLTSPPIFNTSLGIAPTGNRENRWVGCILIRSGCKRAIVASVAFLFLSTKEEGRPGTGRMCMLNAALLTSPPIFNTSLGIAPSLINRNERHICGPIYHMKVFIVVRDHSITEETRGFKK